MNSSLPIHIEVCGGIASGKTTFASLMKQAGLNIILENFRTNPFWEAFYSEPARYAFETEISFMLQHYHYIKSECIGGKINICDFSYVLDKAYADIGLKDSKLNAFLTVYEEIKKELPPPVLLVYLNCDPKVELQRIRNRGRAEENKISLEFLQSLNNAVKYQVANRGDDIKVVEIDSAQKNFVEDETVKKELLDLIVSLTTT